jgi:hypothetical protein
MWQYPYRGKLGIIRLLRLKSMECLSLRVNDVRQNSQDFRELGPPGAECGHSLISVAPFASGSPALVLGGYNLENR